MATAKKPAAKKATPKKGPAVVRPLSAKERRFCEEYVVDCNGAQAAIRAGYSAKTAAEQASRLLGKVNLKQYVQELQQRLSEKTEVSAERVIREVASIAFSDPRKLFDPTGNPLPITELDDVTAAAVASVEVDTLWDGNGKERKAIGITTKIKLWDKNSAAEKLMKHLGLFEKDNRQKTDPITELVAAINGSSLKVVKDA